MSDGADWRQQEEIEQEQRAYEDYLFDEHVKKEKLKGGGSDEVQGFKQD